MTDLLERIAADTAQAQKRMKHGASGRTHTNHRCIVGDIIFDLDDEDAEAVTRALANYRQYSIASVVRVLDASGYPVSYSAMKRHRRRLCACYPAVENV